MYFDLRIAALAAPFVVATLAGPSAAEMVPVAVSPIAPVALKAVEPVTISRSGYAVARVDLSSTGGLDEELTGDPVSVSARPSARSVDAPAFESLQDEAATARSIASAIGRVIAAPETIAPRRTVARPAPVIAPRRAAPRRTTQVGRRETAAPGFLLGVYR